MAADPTERPPPFIPAERRTSVLVASLEVLESAEEEGVTPEGRKERWSPPSCECSFSRDETAPPRRRHGFAAGLLCSASSTSSSAQWGQDTTERSFPVGLRTPPSECGDILTSSVGCEAAGWVALVG
jgi:hypothetical protein